MERLQKIIAASGVASRRKAEQLITEGKVSVNGKIVRELGTSADPEKDQITVQGRELPKVQTVVYAVNKPRGYVCSRVTQGKEHIVTELVPGYPKVYPVGRLDKESEGLILLTNDGALAQRLTHPSYGHIKEYRVLCTWKDKAGDTAQVTSKLQRGVWLGDGKATADRAELQELENGRIDLTIVIHEGRHHLIRRMCSAVGLKVSRLTRVKIGTITLRNIASGSYRVLTAAERRSLL